MTRRTEKAQTKKMRGSPRTGTRGVMNRPASNESPSSIKGNPARCQFHPSGFRSPKGLSDPRAALFRQARMRKEGLL